MKTEELLAVLDLPEEDQNKWIYEHAVEYGYDNHPAAYIIPCFKRAALFMKADLAFRLRDEVFALEYGGNIWDEVFALEYGGNIWAEGYLEVIKKAKPDAVRLNCSVEWWNCCAKPIHWIIAALIAKELCKE